MRLQGVLTCGASESDVTERILIDDRVTTPDATYVTPDMIDVVPGAMQVLVLTSGHVTGHVTSHVTIAHVTHRVPLPVTLP
jgi:hypothetical protein